jgi:hypothetical protein
LVGRRSFMSSYRIQIFSFLHFRSSLFGGTNSCFWASSCIFTSHCLTWWLLTPIPETSFDLRCSQSFLVLILPLIFHCHEERCATITAPKYSYKYLNWNCLAHYTCLLNYLTRYLSRYLDRIPSPPMYLPNVPVYLPTYLHSAYPPKTGNKSAGLEMPCSWNP